MYADQHAGHIDIQGVRCYFPKKPDKHLIQNYELPKREQKWRKTPLPTFRAIDIDIWDGTDYKADDILSWEEASRQETIKITGCDPTDLDRSGNPRPVPGVDADPEYVSEALENFRSQEIERIHKGHWIYINGKAYWIPGPYYFYLNYWWCGDCYPEFRYPDLELSWLWEFVRKSPVWLGLMYITMRGTGKSYIAGCFDYHTAITRKEARTGIQSKNDDDAGDFFREKILIPVSKLPDFLRGIHKDMYLGDFTKNATLDFSPPARKQINIKVYNKMRQDALYSFMDYRTASEKAYDGQSLSCYIGDEIGKTESHIADVNKRWGVVFNSLWRGGKKRGSGFLISTVEEMSLGGKECKKLWDNSDLGKLNKNGRTATGLVRYFRSALEATYFDEFGFPDIERSKAYHDAERQAREHDQQDLVAYKQKNPYSAEEAFWVTSGKCIYNQEILLLARDRVLNADYKVTRRGDIIWEEIDKKAKWVDNEVNGRWMVSFFNFEQNQTKVDGNKKSPLAGHKRVMFFDPFAAANIAHEDRGSNGASAVYNKFDINIPAEFSETFIADYLYRPNTPQECFEDILTGAFFFGCPVLAESNKGGSDFNFYAKLRGYKWGYDSNPEDFIMERPISTYAKYSPNNNTEGIYSTESFIIQYTNATMLHIVKHGWKLKHVRIIDDWIEFDPKKTKKFDMGVAASGALVAAEPKITAPEEEINIESLFRTYDNSGTYSTIR